MPGDNQSLEWSKEVILRQAKHLGHLLDDLLDVSRFTQGKIQLRQERLEIATVIKKAIEAVRPAFEAKKHHVTVDILSSEMTVVGDSTRIEQVLVNLLGNAIKYTDDGGHIRVTASQGDEVVITVEDTGIGIAPEMLARIFEPFAQDERSLDRSQGGLGIGLTLVRTLVEMHGGKVAAASGGIGKGSTFRISLPQATGDGSVAVKPSDLLGRNKTPEGYRVLIVDDNRDVARSLGVFLSHSGYKIATAFDGHSALELARASKPNALILDIGLPGINGYELARQLRTSSECRDALLIAISGYGQEEDFRRSEEAGFDHHFIKPVDPATLAEFLTSHAS